MSTRQTVSSSVQNSTCRHVGHEWKTSLTETYRTCTRSQCRAAQRFTAGSWRDVPCPPATRKRQPVPTSSSPLTLWNTCFADPGYNPEQERRFREQERFYHKSVADEQVYRTALTRRQRGGV